MRVIHMFDDNKCRIKNAFALQGYENLRFTMNDSIG